MQKSLKFLKLICKISKIFLKFLNFCPKRAKFVVRFLTLIETLLIQWKFCPKTQNSVKFSLKFRAKLSIFVWISYNFSYFIVKLSKISLSIGGGLPPSPEPPPTMWVQNIYPKCSPPQKKIPGSATVFVSSCFMKGAKILIRK